jgi:NAD(P)-dependent dehydrogenase (short-subunit alcohol dehydrogenase family)
MGILEGKVAVVTGAGRGIGRGEAVLLAQEGAKVVVNDLGVEFDGKGGDRKIAEVVAEEIRKSGGEAVANFESVSDFQGAKRIIDAAIAAFGKLDILVNNAGFVRDRMVFKMSEEEFDAVVAVHLKGTFSCGRWACTYFRERNQGGRIINTTSAAGLVGNIGQTNYAAAKAGIAIMTLVWGLEMEKYGVTCNAIAPSARTRMTETTFGEFEPESPGAFDFAAPENIAPLVAVLASDEARHISGRVFGVQGGDIDLYQVWQARKSLSREGRWTAAELSKRIQELF